MMEISVRARSTVHGQEWDVFTVDYFDRTALQTLVLFRYWI